MSSDDLNREQKRQLRRQGALDEHGRPTRAVRQATPDRVGPVQYLREVRDEMRKVAWPNRKEVARYSLIVTVLVVLFTAYIGALDLGLSEIADWFYS
ncbi:MAG TPA: preprotein translocase subunit SecE [Ilumatobacter sp.]|nr:preprotein translocase subunit SecE [Ilumatobacter sp.]